MKSTAVRLHSSYIPNMTIHLYSGFLFSENQRMQNKFHNPTSCIQRASHISCHLSYSPEIILVSHNHTSNIPYVHFGYPSFEKLINLILRCNCISSRNNYLQYFVPGKASIGVINNTSTLFSSRLMGPIQHPSEVNESLTIVFSGSWTEPHDCT